jgi:murein DD-endopeptidase MepM/ murein hydrolase activator NlpD
VSDGREDRFQFRPQHLAVALALLALGSLGRANSSKPGEPEAVATAGVPEASEIGSRAASGRLYRLEFRPQHAVFAIVLVLAAIGSIGFTYSRKLHHAEANVGALRSLTASQRALLHRFDARTSELSTELQKLRVQNEEITRLFVGRGEIEPPPPAHTRARSVSRTGTIARVARDFGAVDASIARLRTASADVGLEGERLRSMAFRVLNVRRLENMAFARVLAAIPSLNPAGPGVAIRSPYGWRVNPWPEFHAGVDLDVDYGDPVRAAAAGTVVAADYDGGYGLKIDIDHGNGYHTWYCHLQHADVQAGDYVAKGQHIASVGSSGESTGPHLHYQIMLAGRAIDPTPYLTGVPDSVLASLK